MNEKIVVFVDWGIEFTSTPVSEEIAQESLVRLKAKGLQSAYIKDAE